MENVSGTSPSFSVSGRIKSIASANTSGTFPLIRPSTVLQAGSQALPAHLRRGGAFSQSGSGKLRPAVSSRTSRGAHPPHRRGLPGKGRSDLLPMRKKRRPCHSVPRIPEEDPPQKGKESALFPPDGRQEAPSSGNPSIRPQDPFFLKK